MAVVAAAVVVAIGGRYDLVKLFRREIICGHYIRRFRFAEHLHGVLPQATIAYAKSEEAHDDLVFAVRRALAVVPGGAKSREIGRHDLVQHHDFVFFHPDEKLVL